MLKHLHTVGSYIDIGYHYHDHPQQLSVNQNIDKILYLCITIFEYNIIRLLYAPVQ